MKEELSIFITERARKRHVDVVIYTDLETLDKIIANNFSNYRELRSYIIKKNNEKGIHFPSYDEYPKIKRVSIARHQDTVHLTPTYEIIDREKVIECCQDALRRKSEFIYNRGEIKFIESVFNEIADNDYKKIPYYKLRECYWALKQLRYTKLGTKVTEKDPNYDIEKYITKNNKQENDDQFIIIGDNYYKYASIVDFNLTGLNEEEYQYGAYLQNKIKTIINSMNQFSIVSNKTYEKLEELYDELMQTCGFIGITHKKR